jgi:hypothetical protein
VGAVCSLFFFLFLFAAFPCLFFDHFHCEISNFTDIQLATSDR